MPLIEIVALDDPRIEPYRNLKASHLSRHGRWFIGEGKRVVERMLESDYPVESVLISERRRAEWEPRVPPDIPLYVVPRELGEQLVGYNFHVGVVACGRRKPSPTLDQVLSHDARTLTVVVCPNVDNPENLGAIIRISSAFGIDAVILGTACSDPFSRRVLRVSMGTVLRLPIVESDNLERDLTRLRDEWRIELAATVLDDAAERLDQITRPPRLGLLFGNEANGLEPRWKELCDRRLTIPMCHGIDSLNVAVAAGIFLYELTRLERSSV